jgi:hypothetical protein
VRCTLYRFQTLICDTWAMRSKHALFAAVIMGGLVGYAFASLPPTPYAPADPRAAIERSH